MQVFFLITISVILHESRSSNLCIADFCPVPTHKQRTRLDTELPLKSLKSHSQSGCSCSKLPNDNSICYNANANDENGTCVKFPSNLTITTSILILKSTYIIEIAAGDFDNLVNVVTFSIDSNQKLAHIRPLAFRGMKNLAALTLVFNPSLSTIHPNAFQGLVNLRELHMVKNGFQSISVLAVALRPTILPRLLKLEFLENVFEVINETDFSPIYGTEIQELSLTACGIQEIHPKSLRHFKKLRDLRFGRNILSSVALGNLLNETIASSPDLSLLDLESSGFRGTLPFLLLDALGRSKIESLFLSRNQFDVINNRLFPILIPKLKVLVLKDVSAQSIEDQAFDNIPNLRSLELANNKLSFFSQSEFLQNLTYLDLRSNTDASGWEFQLTHSEFQRMRLQYLDLAYTRLLVLKKTDFGDMPQLRILNLKNCSIVSVENGTFQGLTNLNFLNMDNNKFFELWMSSSFDMFQGLENLEVLSLEGNAITTITTPTKHLLKYLKNLTHLILKGNNLQILSQSDFESLTKLELLDVSHNLILSWDNRVFINNNLKTFFGSVNKISYLSDAMLQDFANSTHIEIESSNSFDCDCRVKNKMSNDKSGLIKFLNITKEEGACSRPPNMTLHQFIRNSVLTQICFKNLDHLMIYPISFSILFLILVILGIILYIYRWQLKYWMFLVNLRLIRKGRTRNTQIQYSRNYQFDAFISYCNHDQNFVVKLVSELEGHEPYLKLCVFERDFQIGSVISESVLEHIEKSRKIVLVVSDSYAKSYWCNWETQIAEHYKIFSQPAEGNFSIDDIVLIKLDSIIETHLNSTLKYLLRTRIYLQWPEDLERQKQFWSKLRQLLLPSINDMCYTTHL